ncbi:hypothetical protein BH10ACI1_BH10ACI1_24420 [soil metagenome]
MFQSIMRIPLSSVGICLWEPDETHKFVNTPPSECPVCGISEFTESNRLSAMLNPKFEFGFGYLMLVWVHLECFEDCTETNEPEPTPW